MSILSTPTLILAICSALLLGSASLEAREAETDDISGNWDLELNLPDGDIFGGTLNLQQEAGEITGTWQREGGADTQRVSGAIEGKTIAFFWTVDLPSRSGGADAGVRVSFEGHVEGTTMVGTASFGSRAEDLDWTAKRTD